MGYQYSVEVENTEGTARSSLGLWVAYAWFRPSLETPSRKIMVASRGNTPEEAIANLRAKLPQAEQDYEARERVKGESFTFTLDTGAQEKPSAPSFRSRLSSLAGGA